MKYVYVLASDSADFYYEQALVSIYSLRMIMPDAEIFLIIDDKTEETLSDTRRKAILALITKLKVIKLDATLDKKKRSRWLKTEMREYIEGDFLYIDVDTVICENLSDIVNQNVDLGLVLGSHQVVENHYHKNHIRKIEEKLSFSPTFAHYNGGIIFCRDTKLNHDFFKKWHELWLYSVSKNITQDQPSLNETNYELDFPIKPLNPEWNCQVNKGGLKFLKEAKILHYFAALTNKFDYEPSYRFEGPFIPGKIRLNNGIIPDDVKEMIKYAKFQFNDVHLLASKKMLEFIDSEFYRDAYLVYRNHKKIYKLLEKELVIIDKICNWTKK